MQKRDGGCRFPPRDEYDDHQGPAVLSHPAHGMSPSVGLKSERFLALCDPIESPQLKKNVQLTPRNALLILL